MRVQHQTMYDNRNSGALYKTAVPGTLAGPFEFDDGVKLHAEMHLTGHIDEETKEFVVEEGAEHEVVIRARDDKGRPTGSPLAVGVIRGDDEPSAPTLSPSGHTSIRLGKAEFMKLRAPVTDAEEMADAGGQHITEDDEPVECVVWHVTRKNNGGSYYQLKPNAPRHVAARL